MGPVFAMMADLMLLSAGLRLPGSQQAEEGEADQGVQGLPDQRYWLSEAGGQVCLLFSHSLMSLASPPSRQSVIPSVCQSPVSPPVSPAIRITEKGKIPKKRTISKYPFKGAT